MLLDVANGVGSLRHHGSWCTWKRNFMDASCVGWDEAGSDLVKQRSLMCYTPRYGTDTWKANTDHMQSSQITEFRSSSVTHLSWMFESPGFVGVTNFHCLSKGGCDHSYGPHVGDQQQKAYNFASMDLLCHQWSNCQQQCSCLRQKINQHRQEFKGIFRIIKKMELTTILRHEVGSKKSKWCGHRK
jgi:hypothetical protein